MEACHYGRGYNITLQDFESAAGNSWHLRYILLRIPYCKGDYYRFRGDHLAIIAALNGASSSLGMLLEYGFNTALSTKVGYINEAVEKAMAGRGGKIFTSPAHEYKEPKDTAQDVEVRVDEYSFDLFNAAGVFGAKARAGGLEALSAHFIRTGRDHLGGMTKPSIVIYQTEEQFNKSNASIKYGLHWVPRSSSKASQYTDLELTPFQAAAFSGCVDGLRRVSRLFSGDSLKTLLNHAVKCDIVIGSGDHSFAQALVTPVFMAIAGNQPDCLEFLISHESTDKNLCVDGHRSYLFFAALYNRVKCLQVLLRHKATDFTPQFSPFIVAAKDNQLAALHLIYRHWKEDKTKSEDDVELFVNFADDDGKTAAYHAANNGHKDALDRVVVDYNADFKTRRDALSSSNLEGDKYGHSLKFLVFAIIGLTCCVAFWLNYTYGEINYNCIRYYDNILLQPYLVIFLNTVVFLFVQSGLDNATKTFYFSLAIKDFFLIYFGISKSEVNNANRAEIKAVDEEEQCTGFDGFASLKEMVMGKGKEKDPETVEDFCFGFKHSRTTFIGRLLTVWENVSEGQSKTRYLNEVKTDEYYTGSDFCTQFFWIFFYVQFANAAIAIIVAFIKSDAASTRLSSWARYEDIFAVIVNSGVSSFVVSAYLIHVVRPAQVKMLREWVVQFIFQTPQFEEQPFLPELQRRLFNLCLFPIFNTVSGVLFFSFWLFASVFRTFLGLSGKFVSVAFYAATHFMWTLGFATSTVLFFAHLDGSSLVPTCLTAFAPLLLVALVQLYLGVFVFFRGLNIGGRGPMLFSGLNGMATFFFAAVVAMIGFKLDYPVEAQWLPWRAIAGVAWFTLIWNSSFNFLLLADHSSDGPILNPNFLCYILYGLPFVIGFSMYAWVGDVGSSMSPFPFYSYFLAQQMCSFIGSFLILLPGELFWRGVEEFEKGLGGHFTLCIYGIFISWWQSMLVVFVATKAYPVLTSYSLVMIPTYVFLFGAAAEHCLCFLFDGGQRTKFPYRSLAWVNQQMLGPSFFYNEDPDGYNYFDAYLQGYVPRIPDPYVVTMKEEMANHFDLFEKEKRTFWRSLFAEVLIFFPALFVLPPIVTHVIPGLFVFAWISLPVLLLAFLSYSCSREDFHRHLPSVVRYFLRLQYEVSSRFVAIFLLQVLYNYSAILYSKSLPISSSDYIDVITFDYKIRTQSYCFFSSLWEGVGKTGEANARTIITFMAWL